MRISVGHCGVWGINSEQSVFYRLNSYGDPDNEGTGDDCKIFFTPEAFANN